jgi:regulator of sirC expression with transglutaminase-like and TPR domain
LPQDREIAALFKLLDDDDARIAEAAWEALLQRADRARTALAAVADGMDDDGTRARGLLEAIRRRELIAEAASLAADGDASLDLETGALLIARFGDPAVEADRARAMLDSIAAGLGQLPGPSGGPLPQLEALNRHLVHGQGFHYQRARQAEPADSYLHRVLERRHGLPVTLAVVWILVGRRLGATVHGINMPGRFLAAWDANGRRVFFDPADGGRPLSRADCARLLSQAGMAFSDGLLSPVPARLILVRMINNLIDLSERRDGPGGAEAAWWDRLRATLLRDAEPPDGAADLGAVD